MEAFLYPLAAYILGSIPTAVWVGRSWYGIDVREHGSCNAGATNTFRVLGKKPGIVVLLIDIIKGLVAVLPPMLLIDDPATRSYVGIACAVAAVLGHVFPVFAGFKGGKGVATSLGVVIALAPAAAGIALAVFLVVFLTWRYVSLGALCGALTFPVLIWLWHPEFHASIRVFSVVLCVAVFLTHRANIGRLLAGTENKMGRK